MTTVGYKLTVDLETGGRITREALLSRVTSALSTTHTQSRFTVLCSDAETRLNETIVGNNYHLVIVIAVTRRDNRPLEAVDFVLLDSIAFGAMKAAAGQGWSVDEIRHRLAPVGTSSESVLTTLRPGYPSGARRMVSEANTCTLTVVQPALGQSTRVVSGATPGATRQGPTLAQAARQAITPQDSPELPPLAIAGIALGVTAGLAVVTAYVWRSFK